MDFENNLKKLEDIVEKIESGDLSLDESLKAFEEGVRLSKDCNEKLHQAEQKVKMLLSVDETGQAQTEPLTSVQN